MREASTVVALAESILRVDFFSFLFLYESIARTTLKKKREKEKERETTHTTGEVEPSALSRSTVVGITLFSRCDCLSLLIETAPSLLIFIKKKRFVKSPRLIRNYVLYIYIHISLEGDGEHTRPCYITIIFYYKKCDTNEFISLLMCVTPNGKRYNVITW